MCYTVSLISLLCGIFLFVFSSPNAHDNAKGHDYKWQSGHMITEPPRLLALTAEQVQTTAPEKKQPTPGKQDTDPAKGKQEEKPTQQTDKKTLLKDFQPSEKIDADKAVDFPADI